MFEQLSAAKQRFYYDIEWLSDYYGGGWKAEKASKATTRITQGFQPLFKVLLPTALGCEVLRGPITTLLATSNVAQLAIVFETTTTALSLAFATSIVIGTVYYCIFTPMWAIYAWMKADLDYKYIDSLLNTVSKNMEEEKKRLKGNPTYVPVFAAVASGQNEVSETRELRPAEVPNNQDKNHEEKMHQELESVMITLKSVMAQIMEVAKLDKQSHTYSASQRRDLLRLAVALKDLTVSSKFGDNKAKTPLYWSLSESEGENPIDVRMTTYLRDNPQPVNYREGKIVKINEGTINTLLGYLHGKTKSQSDEFSRAPALTA